jgi:hypothetical protein
LLGSQLLRAAGVCLGALGLYVLATFPTRLRLAREHYKMWREERQLAKERAHVKATIRRVAADAHADAPEERERT